MIPEDDPLSGWPNASQDAGSAAPPAELRVFRDDQMYMAGTMGYQDRDAFTVARHQVRATLAPNTTVMVTDNQTRNATRGERLFQEISELGGHAMVVLNVTTFATDEVRRTFEVNRGAFAHVNTTRSIRDSANPTWILINATNLNGTLFWMDIGHVATVNPFMLRNATPLEAYTDAHTAFVNTYETTFNRGYNHRVWTEVRGLVTNIDQEITELRNALTVQFRPDMPNREYVVTRLENVVRDTLHHTITNLQTDPSTITFIQEQYDTLVQLAAAPPVAAAGQTLYESALDDTRPAPIFGAYFRGRGLTSAELDSFKIKTVHESMDAIVLAINVIDQPDRDRIWAMFVKATEMLHAEDPFTVILDFIEQTGLDNLRPIIDNLRAASRRVLGMLDQLNPNNRHGHMERGRQLGEARNQLAESEAARQAADADALSKTALLAEATAQIAEVRAMVERQNAERRQAAHRESAARRESAAAMATSETEFKALRDLDKKRMEEMEAELRSSRESSDRRIRDLEAEIARLNAFARNHPPMSVPPLVEDGEAAGSAWVCEDSQEIAMVHAAIEAEEASTAAHLADARRKKRKN